jgi:predicted ATP-grasp superfamily ATP-dependent carboligase
MAIAEFKIDPRDGAPRFIEVNARSVVYNGLLRRAGLDLARLAWEDYTGDRPRRGHDNGWPGVWINLHSDLLHSLLYSGERPGWADFSAPYARPRIEAVWSAGDPAPFAAQWSKTAGEAVSALSPRLVGRTARRRHGTSPPRAARRGDSRR